MKLRIARPSLVVDISRLDLRGIETRGGELHIGAAHDVGRAASLRRPRPTGARRDPRVRGRHRRSPGAQPRNGRRQRRARRPGLRHASRAARPRRTSAAPLPIRRARGRARGRARRTVPDRPRARRAARRRRARPVPPPARAPPTPPSSIPRRGSRSSVRPRSSAPSRRTSRSPESARRRSSSTASPRRRSQGADVYGDRFASAEYRRELAAVLARRALDSARERAQEDR